MTAQPMTIRMAAAAANQSPSFERLNPLGDMIGHLLPDSRLGDEVFKLALYLMRNHGAPERINSSFAVDRREIAKSKVTTTHYGRVGPDLLVEIGLIQKVAYAPGLKPYRPRQRDGTVIRGKDGRSVACRRPNLFSFTDETKALWPVWTMARKVGRAAKGIAKNLIQSVAVLGDALLHFAHIPKLRAKEKVYMGETDIVSPVFTAPKADEPVPVRVKPPEHSAFDGYIARVRHEAGVSRRE